MSFFNSYFTDTQIYLLLFAGLFLLLAFIMHVKEKNILSVVFLGLTAICIFSFSALLDPFLNLWDERFHALVAKNMMNHPLMPTLYDDPVVDMAYDRWDRYYIWLHKQPLFLWQIMLSFKIFGLSEFSLRIPNIVMGTALVIATYRSGKLIVDRNVGFISSLLTISTVYIMELAAGRQELEHNDFSFLVYISLSIWAFIEYYYSKKKIWIYLIGLFSGMAILCKWVVGLLVYFGWFVLRLMQKKIKLSENKDFLTALSITLIVALPWQILTFLWYPAEAMSAYKFNTSHFTVPLDGHDGSFWYHFDMFNTIYGKLASFLIIPAFWILYKNNKDNNLLNSLVSMVLVVYLFFSLAATKMPSFTIVVSMIVIIAFGTLLYYAIEFVNQYVKKDVFKHIIFIVIITAIVMLRFDIGYIADKYTLKKDNNHYTMMLTHNKEVFKSLELPSNTVLFNVKGRHYIEAMFYTGVPAYNFMPSFEQYRKLKDKGRIIAVFVKNDEKIPDFLKDDISTIFIHKEIMGYE